jgi:hypothetical protein
MSALIGLMRLRLVAPAQLIDKALEAGRGAGRLKPQLLLETFADCVADRPAGLMVQRFDAFVCLRTFHDPFRTLTIDSIR